MTLHVGLAREDEDFERLRVRAGGGDANRKKPATSAVSILGLIVIFLRVCQLRLRCFTGRLPEVRHSWAIAPFLSYLMRMSFGASVDASIAVIVSRTLLAFMHQMRWEVFLVLLKVVRDLGQFRNDRLSVGA